VTDLLRMDVDGRDSGPEATRHPKKRRLPFGAALPRSAYAVTKESRYRPVGRPAADVADRALSVAKGFTA
jgi:hypothetical protein